MAYQTGNVSLQAPIKVRMTGVWEGETVSKILDTTVGRIIFNQSIPQDLGRVDRNNRETFLDLEVDETVDKNGLTRLVDDCFACTAPRRPRACWTRSSAWASTTPRAEPSRYRCTT